jgi:flagellar biogenesis protein FliO
LVIDNPSDVFILMSYIIFCLLSVIVLIYLVLKFMQRYVYVGGSKMMHFDSMNVLATTYIDSNNKIVKFRNLNTHYVILISKNNSVLLDKYEEFQTDNHVS